MRTVADRVHLSGRAQYVFSGSCGEVLERLRDPYPYPRKLDTGPIPPINEGQPARQAAMRFYVCPRRPP